MKYSNAHRSWKWWWAHNKCSMKVEEFSPHYQHHQEETEAPGSWTTLLRSERDGAVVRFTGLWKWSSFPLDYAASPSPCASQWVLQILQRHKWSSGLETQRASARPLVPHTTFQTLSLGAGSAAPGLCCCIALPKMSPISSCPFGT